ncbi:hypothetical protein JJB07_16900 [Tumebacillus sp. ITR2]|uniref:Uncharacterized protein n=1 Tax=Tumebacillus amylolyticus TaxID=2801339 RepID=A0ABS1JDD3_9BACL|nr:hypothetical protein [Tumebacillus amylolyticus]MBL0388285.1 hypothetical protein [Tumebacillus amylolyticus]
MALFNLPTIKPSKGTVYAMGIFLATFVYFFTRAEPVEQESETVEK